MRTLSAFSKENKTLFLFILLALALRIYHLGLPLFEPYNSVTRQSIGATVARNFYQHGFNFFYPEIDQNGAGSSLFNLEMQFNSYLAAIGYWMAGGVREWIARGVSVLLSIGALLFLYLFTQRLYDKKTAFWALAFASITPFHLALSRAVQPEEMMIFTSLGALFFYYLYQETRRKKYFFLSALCMFAAIGSKLYSLYLFIPLLFLGFQYEGKKVFRNPLNVLYLVLSLSACLWWFAMWRIGQSQELAFTAYHYSVHRAGEGMSYLRVLFHWPYLKGMGKVFILHLLTPLGAVFFFAGSIQKPKTKADLFMLVWLGSVVFFTLVFLRAAIQHPYYLAPFIMVCAIFVGRGARRFFASPSAVRCFRNPLLLTFLILLEGASLLYFYKRLYFISPKFYAIVAAGREVDRLTPKNSLVVASHGTSAIQLYYCNRKGWPFGLVAESDENLILRLEKMRTKGADFLVISSMEELARVPVFEKYLRDHFQLITDRPECHLFKLKT